ncbi:hypothetical protein SO802_015654 [Lithocarpus litseifolius]|uniref:RNase H type-1 domain-containing protein n=1 Tax=Lithocarpus litseifolius TaxID=425828 RepID=A0AAW2CWD7_9ROSI
MIVGCAAYAACAVCNCAACAAVQCTLHSCTLHRLGVAALRKKLWQPLGPLEVKAKAFEAGLLFAQDIVIREIILEGDFLVVSNALARKSHSPSSIASVVYGSTSLSDELRRV